MNIIEQNIEKLIPYENNPRNNDNAVDQVAESIKEFGFQQPIVVDKENVVIVGHTRLKAAKRLGLKKVPVVVADELTDEQAKAYRLADNKTNEIATWNFDILNEELLDICHVDMRKFGFDMSALADELVAEEDDYIPDDNIEAKVEKGDVWQLGNHRLMCGDSTSEEDVEILLGGATASLLLTDPPYGIDIVKGSKMGDDDALHFGKIGGGNWVESKTYSAIIGDDTTETAKYNFDIVQALTDNQIIFGGNYFTDFLSPSRCWIVWDKQNTGNFADAELAWTSFNKGVKLYKYLWNGLCREGERKVEGKTRVHPTQKPVGLFANILKDFSKENDKIIDCFGGSGSTLIACEQLNRNCYMMELDPHYCTVIIDRWESFTGQKAMKINEQTAMEKEN